ncbi:MAG: ribosome silencing factor [Bacteroidia bacterium]|nr:ribosome silencing factor [Bacteroidia bacterium]
MNKKKSDETDLLVMGIVAEMQEKKAKSIKILDLRKLKSGFTDCFVICHGTSDRHVESIADSVEETVRKKLKEKPWHIEGTERNEWVLIDYINVVAHIFVEPKRNFYAIEELWGDAEITEFDDVL